LDGNNKEVDLIFEVYKERKAIPNSKEHPKMVCNCCKKEATCVGGL
jgi:hypothetical protein